MRKETLERDYERLPHEPLTQDELVEAAVRNTILQLRGIDTYERFVERHRQAMKNNQAD